MDWTDMKKKAAAFARIAHAGQKYGDHDYFSHHVEGVVSLVREDRSAAIAHVVVAYLHDVVEDTETTLVDLHHMGFPPMITSAIDALTRRPGEDYLSDYMARVAGNRIAMIVKHADLRFNTNEFTPASLARRNGKALAYLDERM